MEKDKSSQADKQVVGQIAKDYLRSLGIDFEPGNDKDRCRLIVDEKYGLFYVETNKDAYIKTTYPGDAGYPSQAEGLPCPCYSFDNSYRFVIDSNHKIVVDVDKCEGFWAINHNKENIFVDEQNIFLPIIDDEYTGSFPPKNKIQHFKIQDGQGLLVRTFHHLPIIEPRLNKNKLVVIDGQLYDYQKADFIGCKFDHICSGQSYVLEYLARDLGIPREEYSKNKQKDFVDGIIKKMADENLLIGISNFQAQKDDFHVGYSALVFLDMKGDPASDLYYVDDNHDLISIPVSPENISLALKHVSEKAETKLAEKIAHKQKAYSIFAQIKEKILK